MDTINRLTNTKENSPTACFKFFGNTTTFILDTGTNINIISKTTFFKMTTRPKLNQSFTSAYSFNSNNRIPILGEFKATLRCNYKRVRAKFLVLDGHADNLLGYETAVKLGLIEIKQSKIQQKK